MTLTGQHLYHILNTREHEYSEPAGCEGARHYWIYNLSSSLQLTQFYVT